MLLADGLLVAIAEVAAVVGSRQAQLNRPGAQPLDRLGYALIVVAVAALLVRRTWPRAVLTVTVALGAAYSRSGTHPGRSSSPRRWPCTRWRPARCCGPR